MKQRRRASGASPPSQRACVPLDLRATAGVDERLTGEIKRKSREK